VAATSVHGKRSPPAGSYIAGGHRSSTAARLQWAMLMSCAHMATFADSMRPTKAIGMPPSFGHAVWQIALPWCSRMCCSCQTRLSAGMRSTVCLRSIFVANESVL
jgi:hypothetical protein